MQRKLFWNNFGSSRRQKRIAQLKKFDSSWNIDVFPGYIVKSIAKQLKVGCSDEEKKGCGIVKELSALSDIDELIVFAKLKYESYKLKNRENCSMNELNMQMFYGILWRLLLLVQKRREMCSILLGHASF